MTVVCIGPLVRVVDGFLLVKTKDLEGLPLVRTMKVVGAFPLVRVEAVVLVRLVSVSLKTEYSPGKSCV